MKEEFAYALTGKPESTKTTSKFIMGYIISDVLNYRYVMSTKIHLKEWRVLESETDTYWVIEETMNPYFKTKFILFKNRDFAIENLKKLGPYYG